MTVAQLIEELQKQPPDAHVLLWPYDGQGEHALSPAESVTLDTFEDRTWSERTKVPEPFVIVQ